MQTSLSRDDGPEVDDIGVVGMTCAACVGRIERAVAALPGVRAVTVDLAGQRATVTHEAGKAPRPVLEAAIRKAGYEIASLADLENVERRADGARRRDLWIAVGLTVPLLVLGMSHDRIMPGLPGVENVTIRLSPGQATIIHDPVASESALRLAITEAGYEASLLDAPSENRTKGA